MAPSGETTRVSVLPPVSVKIGEVVVGSAEKGRSAGLAQKQEVLAPDDKTAIVTVATEGLQKNGDTTRALRIIRLLEGSRDTRGQRALESHLKILKESKDPADRALALDFDIARRRLELPGEKEEARKVELTASLTKLEEERGKIPEHPTNVFEDMAVRMTGISPDDAKESSLKSVLTMFENVKGDRKADAVFFKHLQDKGFSAEEIGVSKDILRIMRGEPTKLEKTRDVAVRVGGIMGGLMLLMAWLGSKEKQGAGAMG